MYAFSFIPRTDAEIQDIKNRKLLSEGIYPFIVREVSPEVSKSNNPMLKVRLGIIDNQGNERSIIDYLLATDEMIFKLKHFCESIGFEEEYSKGSFDPLKAIGRSGSAKIGIQKGNIRNDGTLFDDKNSVRDYVKTEFVQKKPVEIAPPLNDDIAF